MKIITSILILITTCLCLKHGWDGLHINQNPEQAKTLAAMGIGKTAITILSLLNMAVGIAILFPQTFFWANLIHALMLVSLMAFSLRTGNYKTALIEIPFLLIPLVLIYLGHPLKNPK